MHVLLTKHINEKQSFTQEKLLRGLSDKNKLPGVPGLSIIVNSRVPKYVFFQTYFRPGF